MDHTIYNKLTLKQRQIVTELNTLKRDIADLEVARDLLDHTTSDAHPSILRMNYDARQIKEDPSILDDKHAYLASLETMIVKTDDQLAHDLGLHEPTNSELLGCLLATLNPAS